MTINHDKLCLHNMAVPFAKRISAAELQARVNAARQRGNTLALWATFHVAAQAQVQADNARMAGVWQALGQ